MGEKLKEAAMNVGGHYILLKGVGETTFNELKSKIGEDWTYEDIKEMEDFNSFNMIWIRGQHYRFMRNEVRENYQSLMAVLLFCSS